MSTEHQLTNRELEQLAENQVQDLVYPYCDSPFLSLVEIALPPEQAEQVGKIASKGAAGGFFGALGLGLIAGPPGAIAGLLLGGGGVALIVQDQVSKPTATVECEECRSQFTQTIESA